MRRRRWFASYLSTILERDIRRLADIQRLEQLLAVLAAIAPKYTHGCCAFLGL